MKIARSVEKEWRESWFDFAIEILDLTRRRGNAKRGPQSTASNRTLLRSRMERNRAGSHVPKNPGSALGRFFHARRLFRKRDDRLLSQIAFKVAKEQERRQFHLSRAGCFHVFAQEMFESAWQRAGVRAAVLIIVIWAVTRADFFHFSDTWQLIINTGTTIVTFLMVFLIQNTQNRDAKAVHLKLDELIRALAGARDDLVDLEELSDEELKKLEQEFKT